MKNEIKLVPKHCAMVSGGKDSLLMLQIILKNPDKYPLDYVVHCDLEIDYPFIKSVVDEMETMCNKVGVPLLRIKPRNKWIDLYNRKGKKYEYYGFPTRLARWCNSDYKMDAVKQCEEWLYTHGCEMIKYIGYCVDEVKRYENRKNPNEIYPLVMENIEEKYILDWAKHQEVFNGYYKIMDRCGCMLCLMCSRLELAYQFKYYRDIYDEHIRLMNQSEEMKKRIDPSLNQNVHGNLSALELDKQIRTKWLKKLEDKEKIL